MMIPKLNRLVLMLTMVVVMRVVQCKATCRALRVCRQRQSALEITLPDLSYTGFRMAVYLNNPPLNPCTTDMTHGISVWRKL